MTKKEMIQAMLDGRSFQNASGESVIRFHGDSFILELNDGSRHTLDINNLSYKNYKPVRTWEDDVRDGKPVLCWVSSENKHEKVVAAPIDKINVNAFKYVDNEGDGWKYATPVKPSECWGGG